jgi:YidC/Oxa1 family membrane protein insertase
MNIFDLIIVQPIFNVLLFIYGILPGHDFGLSIIIFTILVRLALWPLIKKQLHQTKLMRKVQPELKKLKARTKGDRQAEAKLMMELYRERGIKPFSSIGVLLIQLPIFIALFQVISIITQHSDKIAKYVYGFIQPIDAVNRLIDNPHAAETFFGIVNLAKTAFQGGKIYPALVALALLAALFQYIQTRQLMPQNDSKKKLRDILKASGKGEKVDQSEMTAIMTGKMALFMPLLLLVFALYLPGAVILYYAVSSIVAVIQQHIILSRDEEELMEIADQSTTAATAQAHVSANTTIRLRKAKKAKLSKRARKRR